MEDNKKLQCNSNETSYPFQYPCPFCSISKLLPDAYETPTTCLEAKDPTPRENMEAAVLFAEGVVKISDSIYPEEVTELMEVFMKYDEPIHPIPVGASIFYFIMIAWITTFYFTYLGRKMLSNVKEKLDLHPEANRFPNLPLYWLQQSRREAELRREVRNTWAWLARRYLLSPNDPLLANVNQVLGLVNWHDFEVTRNTWSLIRCVLKMNSLFLQVRRYRNDRAKKSFRLLRDADLNKLPMEGDQIQRIFEEWDPNEDNSLVKRLSPPKLVVSQPTRKRSVDEESTATTQHFLKSLFQPTKPFLQQSKVTTESLKPSPPQKSAKPASGKGKSKKHNNLEESSTTDGLLKPKLGLKKKTESAVSIAISEAEDEIIPLKSETDLKKKHKGKAKETAPSSAGSEIRPKPTKIDPKEDSKKKKKTSNNSVDESTAPIYPTDLQQKTAKKAKRASTTIDRNSLVVVASPRLVALVSEIGKKVSSKEKEDDQNIGKKMAKPPSTETNVKGFKPNWPKKKKKMSIKAHKEDDEEDDDDVGKEIAAPSSRRFMKFATSMYKQKNPKRQKRQSEDTVGRDHSVLDFDDYTNLKGRFHSSRRLNEDYGNF